VTGKDFFAFEQLLSQFELKAKPGDRAMSRANANLPKSGFE
jgi:hypothetical protein